MHGRLALSAAAVLRAAYHFIDSDITVDIFSGVPLVSDQPAWISKVGGFFKKFDPQYQPPATRSTAPKDEGASDEVRPPVPSLCGPIVAPHFRDGPRFDFLWQGSSSDGEFSGSGEDDDEEEEEEEEEDKEGEEGGEAAEGISAEEEAAAGERVRALLFSKLAVKREDGDVKMDMFAEASGPPSGVLPVSQESIKCKVVVFAEEQLGMVLNKGKKGEAVVASVVRGSPARQAGLVQGDVVLGINAVRTSDFNQVLWLLRHAERPMHLLLLDRHPEP